MHFNAENIQQQENHRAAQGEHLQLAAADKHGNDQRKGHGHGQYAKESPCAACETKGDICQRVCRGNAGFNPPQAEFIVLTRVGVYAPCGRNNGEENADTQRCGVFDGIPVSIEKVEKVGCIDRCIGIGLKRGAVLFNQPPGRLLIRAKGQHNHQCQSQ